MKYETSIAEITRNLSVVRCYNKNLQLIYDFVHTGLRLSCEAGVPSGNHFIKYQNFGLH